MDLPQYTSFLNADNMGEFWKILKWVLFYIAPIIMIWFAIHSVTELISRIKGSVSGEDEDREIYYYKDRD
ncbi:hypothetical protein [Bacillus sp. UMTAT18]|uniref:hypothetical protein n=1 Tax=Bacillus sp. UMTAT18 TaxID=1565146 RepID=UPI0006186766|nr:hypothetical protein [Bacillus sp. UMTAT18]